jgi:hypothetical protein
MTMNHATGEKIDENAIFLALANFLCIAPRIKERGLLELFLGWCVGSTHKG